MTPPSVTATKGSFLNSDNFTSFLFSPQNRFLLGMYGFLHGKVKSKTLRRDKKQKKKLMR